MCSSDLDYIRMIGDTPTRDMSVFTGTRLLRGAVGSSVKVMVIRGNAAEPHEVTLTREKVAPAVRGEMAAKEKVAVIRLAAFDAGAEGVDVHGISPNSMPIFGLAWLHRKDRGFLSRQFAT